jgi:hypothetical protein
VEAHGTALAALSEGRGAEPPLDQALSRVERLVASGSELMIASGFDVPGAGLADRLASLERRRRPRLLLISDGAVARMPRGRYPVRLADGRRLRLALGGDASADPEPVVRIAGRVALVLDAGETVEQTARRIAATFPSGHTA